MLFKLKRKTLVVVYDKQNDDDNDNNNNNNHVLVGWMDGWIVYVARMAPLGKKSTNYY